MAVSVLVAKCIELTSQGSSGYKEKNLLRAIPSAAKSSAPRSMAWVLEGRHHQVGCYVALVASGRPAPCSNAQAVSRSIFQLRLLALGGFDFSSLSCFPDLGSGGKNPIVFTSGHLEL